MNKLRIAAAVAALTSALALPAWAANANDPQTVGASNIDQPVQQPADTAARAGQADAKPSQANPRKHPPTSAMDSATPSDKPTSEKPASNKHPPTTRMDRAAPDEKSPAAPSDANSTGPGASAASPRN